MYHPGEVEDRHIAGNLSCQCYDCITEPVIVRYGECSKCNCPGFVDQYGSELCGNCGHQYTDHF